jgi:hypothetical protein
MAHQTSRKTADAGYETRTRHPMDTGIEERQAVPMWQTRPRESIDILKSNSNGVGTRSGGAYQSSDNHSIFGNRNGNRFGQDAARGPNMTTNTTPVDGMEHYRVNVGYVDVRFMCGNGKGFNVARGIKQFIAAARAIDTYFCLLPLGGQYNNLCIPADVPNSKEGILR